MSFKIAARTILQLGAELVSSDAVAFYELIKNAFDANSPKVAIDVDIAILWTDYVTLCEYITEEKRTSKIVNLTDFLKHKSRIINSVNMACQTAKNVQASIQVANNWADLRIATENANRIRIRDFGEGMSLDDLSDCYLTIGTRSRQRLHCDKTMNARPVLGEKGLGRLSSMRLGSRLSVRTSKQGGDKWNCLKIDWSVFSHDSDALLETVDIKPFLGKDKINSQESGTTITITALSDEWNVDKLNRIASEQFCKLTDPFTPSTRYPIVLNYNSDRVLIPSFDKILFNAAHASGTAHFTVVDGNPKFVGETKYLLRHRSRSFVLENEHLLSASGCPTMSILRKLGPFSVEFYWYNRRILAELDGIGDRKKVLELQSRWAGGLMVFRDGFRVHPYGDPDDDWIDLDSKALSSQGYKVNRRQIIGKVDITSHDNPALRDQTNREGLRDCSEKIALINILKHFLEANFREFLKNVDKEVQAAEPLDTGDIRRRVVAETAKMRQSLKILQVQYPKAAEESGVVRSIEKCMSHLSELLKAAEKEVESYKKGRSEIVHLAGMGLMVELVVHELSRATDHALRTVKSTRSEELNDELETKLALLEEQLKTLQKRLSIIDPASTSKRQVKEKFDVCKLVREIMIGHEAQFSRHEVESAIITVPANTVSWEINMVKGMFIQIIENLLSNSVYWFKQRLKVKPSFAPFIRITIDKPNRIIRIDDNGPGIPIEERERVFEAFYTTKPPGEGKGLGLFISREIARYHGAELQVCDTSDLGGVAFEIVFAGGMKDEREI